LTYPENRVKIPNVPEILKRNKKTPEEQVAEAEAMTPEVARKNFIEMLPYPVACALLTFLIALPFRDNPEATGFITQTGVTATLIFSADSARRFSRFRRIKNSPKQPLT